MHIGSNGYKFYPLEFAIAASLTFRWVLQAMIDWKWRQFGQWARFVRRFVKKFPNPVIWGGVPGLAHRPDWEVGRKGQKRVSTLSEKPTKLQLAIV